MSIGIRGQTPFGAALAQARSHVRVSQLELAARAGTTQRYLSYLERGRSTPGRSLVIRIGESLGLPPQERNNLLLSAGYAPVYPEPSPDGSAPQAPPAQLPADEASLQSLRCALREILMAHGPFPALITDRFGTLLAGNEAFGAGLAGISPDLLIPPVNIRRLALHPRGLAPRVLNFAELSSRMTEKTRRQLGECPDSAGAALLAELDEYAGRAAAPPGFDYLGLAMRLHLASPVGDLRLLSTLTTFSATVGGTVTELRMEALLPADAETAALLQALRARPQSGPATPVPGLLQWRDDTEAARLRERRSLTPCLDL